ncbi:acyl-CoA dehydrogenase family protein [Aminobacter sp. MET-1]|jgi:alkylation response protein AidB-like acyl-CoA dehydrogenase|uniref:acyl-CoA dehydrogenase family protein n=1 Tax=Aminobacter sp. MET-1 TaxID=2951085 RepID=UPI00226A10C7|nr:acyl-CoA dehydrogenase family protein [Aminobacter sp. MET-1]MCX8570111.1 acyl-CoA/acyl-ACP dehydrogenase [Aminobacter sp. MET-1]
MLEFTPDQQMIREEAQRFLREQSSSEAIRRVVDTGTSHDAVLWNSISRELGWCAMAIPEEFGGLGLGATEVAILMELTGARLACVPFWSTVCLAAPLLQSAGSEEAKVRYLGAIAAGEMAVTVAYADLSVADPAATVAVKAIRAGGGYRLAGKVAQVIDFEVADVVLVPAGLEDGTTALFALTRDSGQVVTPLKVLDATRSVAALELTLEVSAESRIDDAGVSAEQFQRALTFANLGLAAEQLGAAQGALDVTLAYIAERVQFGRTIASFQAIKHRCAKLVVDVAETRSLVFGAAQGVGTSGAVESALEIAGARVLASDLQFRAAEEAIQLHGGVGFTWEYDPHLYFKRAQASAALLGAREAQLDRIAASVFADGGLK